MAVKVEEKRVFVINPETGSVVLMKEYFANIFASRGIVERIDSDEVQELIAQTEKELEGLDADIRDAYHKYEWDNDGEALKAVPVLKDAHRRCAAKLQRLRAGLALIDKGSPDDPDAA